MDYSSAEQLFFYSVISGALLSLVFDVTRILRLYGLKDVFSVFLLDFVFCLVCTAVYLVLLYNFSKGVLRFYAFVGMIAGFLLCRCTLGALIIRLFSKLKKYLALFVGNIKIKVKALFKAKDENKEEKAE